jgi:HPt (histidine-containing phosphotransfer) domain-containing protein
MVRATAMIHWLTRIVIHLLILGTMHPRDVLACAKQGVCDLTTVDISWDDPIPVTGDWKLYWKQLLTPDQIQAGQGQLTGYVPLEADWSDMKVGDVELHPNAYATYQVSFLVNTTDPLTIRFPSLPAAAVIWLNDQEIARVGTLSTQGKEEAARQRLNFHTFIPKIGLNTLTINSSNFTYYFHGANGGVAIGKPEKVMADFQANLLRDSLTFGAILIMSFYHFYLWWIRRNRLAPLYFGLFCFAVGLRSLVAGQSQIMSMAFPETPLELQIKIEYLGIALTFFVLILLGHNLYPKEFPKLVAYPWAVIAGLWILLIVLTSALVFPQVLRLYQALILVAGTMLIGSLILAAFRGREGARIFVAGFAVFFATSVADILTAMSVIRWPPIAHIGTFTLVFFQAILLSRRFDRAFDKAEQAEREVRRLNEGLEQKVKERTDQINTILQNVTSGFLLIDRQGILQPGFTDSCHQLIGVNLVPGKPLADMLPIDAKTRMMLRETIVQVFDDIMPTEVSLSQIPYPVAIGERMLSISGAVLRNETGQVWAILFTINDVTRLQAAEKQIRYNEMLIGILREQAAFKVFLEDFRKEIQQSFTALDTNNQKAVRNLLHTMKGNLGAFGMRQLAEFIHEVEGQEPITREHIAELSAMMEDLLHDNKSLLDLERKETTFEVLRADYEAIIEWSSRQLDPRHHRELVKLLRRSRQSPIRSYIGPLQNTVEMLGERLGKDVSCEIQGADLPIDERFSPVLRNLIHLVRNSVDHGIEQKGVVKLTFAQSDKQLDIVVEDNGRGLNADAIKEKAKKSGLWKGEEKEDDIYRLIFAQGFSTAEEVSDISGRGVGMSAILESVEVLSGKLNIVSRPGLGLKVQIQLPMPDDDTSLQVAI